MLGSVLFIHFISCLFTQLSEYMCTSYMHTHLDCVNWWTIIKSINTNIIENLSCSTLPCSHGIFPTSLFRFYSLDTRILRLGVMLELTVVFV